MTLAAQEVSTVAAPEGRPAASPDRGDLLGLRPLRALLLSSYFPLVPQVGLGIVFAYAIYQGLAGSQQADENFASQWLLYAWWPVTVLVTLTLFGRAWCAVCPMGALSNAVQRYGLNRVFPKRWRDLIAPTVLYIFVVWWVMPVFEVGAVPALTALFFGGWTLFALAVGIVYQRGTWCRYLCPIASVLGIYAAVAPVALRPNRAICRDCRSHDCFTGRDDIPSCPLAAFPGQMTTNRACELCMACVKSCQRGSLSLRLRWPGTELLQPANLARGEVMAVIAVVSVFPVMMGLHHAWGPPWLHNLGAGLRVGLGLPLEALAGATTTVALAISYFAAGIGFTAAAWFSARLGGWTAKASLNAFALAFVPQVLLAQLGHVIYGLGIEAGGPLGTMQAVLGVDAYQPMALVGPAEAMLLRGEVWPYMSRLGFVATFVVIVAAADRLQLPAPQRVRAALPYLVLSISLLAFSEYARLGGAILRAAGMAGGMSH